MLQIDAVCRSFENFPVAKSVVSNQPAPLCAVWSGSTLYAEISVMLAAEDFGAIQNFRRRTYTLKNSVDTDEILHSMSSYKTAVLLHLNRRLMVELTFY